MPPQHLTSSYRALSPAAHPQAAARANAAALPKAGTLPGAGSTSHAPALSATRSLPSTGVAAGSRLASARLWLIGAAMTALAPRLLAPATGGAQAWSAELMMVAAPLAICALLLMAGLRLAGPVGRTVTVYALFFAIAAASLLGWTGTMTGAQAGGTDPLWHGMSFYCASLAYALHRGRTRGLLSVAANPMLLATGPVAVRFASVAHKSLPLRLRLFLPYAVLGAFMHQAVGTPLTETFGLIERTDLASTLLFATIFELFVYANFAGLSLLVYGVLGILGLRVPLNFRQPFSATHLIDFWKGWHLSLSAVLKALFYEPARRRWGTGGAVMAVYLCSALWHGVTANFLLWGVFHAGMFMATLHGLRQGAPRWQLGVLLAIALVLGRLLFLDADLPRLMAKLSTGFTDLSVLHALAAMPAATLMALALGVSMVAAEIVFRQHPLFRQRRYKFHRLPLVQLAMVALMLIGLSSAVGVDYAVYGQR